MNLKINFYTKNLNELLSDTKHGIILFFYPKDNTPGCTLEAKAFSSKIQDFFALGVKVFGVSRNIENSHEKFLTKQCLSVPLIDDIDFMISKSYGFYGEKSLFGFKYNSINRSTIFIGKDAKIVKIWSDVSVFSHANEVLDFVEQYLKKNQ